MQETTTRDVLRVGLNVDIHKTGNKESRRVNDILTRLGWRRQQTTRNGQSTGFGCDLRVILVLINHTSRKISS